MSDSLSIDLLQRCLPFLATLEDLRAVSHISRDMYEAVSRAANLWEDIFLREFCEPFLANQAIENCTDEADERSRFIGDPLSASTRGNLVVQRYAVEHFQALSATFCTSCGVPWTRRSVFDAANRALQGYFLPASGGSHCVRMSAHKKSVEAIYFNPTGLLVTGSRDCTLRRWDTSPLWTLPSNEDKQVHENIMPQVEYNGHAEAVWCLDVWEEEGILVSGSADCTARIWDLTSGKLREVLGHHTDSVFVSQFLLSHGALITGSWDGSVAVLRYAPNQEGSRWQTLTRRPLHEDAVWRAAVSPDVTNLLTGSWDGSVGVHNLGDGIRTTARLSTASAVTDVRLSGASLAWAATNSGDVVLWDLREHTKEILCQPFPGVARLCANQNILLLAFTSGALQAFDLRRLDFSRISEKTLKSAQNLGHPRALVACNASGGDPAASRICVEWPFAPRHNSQVHFDMLASATYGGQAAWPDTRAYLLCLLSGRLSRSKGESELIGTSLHRHGPLLPLRRLCRTCLQYLLAVSSVFVGLCSY